MEMRHLQHFIALAEERQFTAAARKVHVVQSGLSVSIKELEQEIGVPLVERSTRRVSLTKAGEVFLEHARASLTALQEGVAVVRSQGNVVRGSLRIGVLQSLRPYLDLPTIVQSFTTAYPEVEFTIRSPGSDRMPDLVRSGHLDLAFLPQTNLSRLNGLTVRPFAEDSLVLVSEHDQPTPRRGRASLADLSHLPFVDLVPERALRVLVDQIFTRATLRRESRYEVSEIETLFDFVRHGLGVAIVPSELARSAAGSGTLKFLKLVQLEMPSTKWRILLLTREAKQRPPASAPLPLFLARLIKQPAS